MKKRQTKFLRMVLLVLFLAAPHSMVCAADDFKALVGRRQRTDGGYIIEIRSIAPDGKIEAGYCYSYFKLQARHLFVPGFCHYLLTSGLNHLSILTKSKKLTRITHSPESW